MPSLTSNTLFFATKSQRYPVATIAQNTAAGTITNVLDADANGTVITDILFRSTNSAAINFDIIICAPGSEANAANGRVVVSVAANSGNNGGAILASLASAHPQLFDLDLAGNRVITLEAGQSLYVKNLTVNTAGAIYVTAKARDY